MSNYSRRKPFTDPGQTALPGNADDEPPRITCSGVHNVSQRKVLGPLAQNHRGLKPQTQAGELPVGPSLALGDGAIHVDPSHARSELCGRTL